MSLDQLYFFGGECDNDGSGSGSPGTFNFSFFSTGEYVGIVLGVGSGDFVPTGIDSLVDIVQLVVFVPRGVESKGGRLIESFWCPKY